MTPMFGVELVEKVGRFVKAYLPRILLAVILVLPWVLWLNARHDYQVVKGKLDSIHAKGKEQKESLDKAVEVVKVEVKEVVKYRTKIEKQVEKVYVQDEASREWADTPVPDAVCAGLSERYCKSSE